MASWKNAVAKKEIMRHSREKTSGEKRECEVCAENVPASSFVKATKACLHPVTTCKKCLAKHVEFELQSKQRTEFQCLTCDEPMGGDEVMGLLSDKARKLYDEVLFKKWQQDQSDFRWCSQPNCGSGGLVDTSVSFFSCAKCHQRTCYRHRVQWHSELSCDEYDNYLQSNETEAATMNYLQRETKQCPRCAVVSAKSEEGCDHVTCVCGHEYCWRCLADFAPIREEGNHHHKDSCTHYFPWIPN